MIKFEANGKRKYIVYNYDVKNNSKSKVIELNLGFSPITNKFNKIIEYVEDCSVKLGDEFNEWFVKLIKDYIDSNRDYIIIKNNIDRLMELCDKYLEICNINFGDYINKSKISRNSIFFDDIDIKKIIQVSSYLKIYFIFSQDAYLQLPSKFHKEVYNRLVNKIINNSNILLLLLKN